MRSNFAPVIFLIFVLGLLGENRLVACAAGLILSLSVSGILNTLSIKQNIFLDIGIIFLIIGVLLPLTNHKVSVSLIYELLFSVDGLAAISVGVFSAILGKKGVTLLAENPKIMIGLVFGSIVGSSFFKGIPTGPLVAAGITALLINLLDIFSK
ncbi:MAG TPA: DUF441 domain-containing protein [Thermoanaerobacterales bacterium]|nr:DUF441 domain-containing protein [Thermoanaerobacterales bacterium]